MKKELDYLLYGIDASKKLLYSKWASPIDSTQYREGLQRLVRIVHDNEIKLWIHESRRLHDLSVEDQKWTTEVVALLLTQSKLRHIAIIRPQGNQQPHQGLSLREKAYRIFGRIIGVEFFDTTEEAKAWILPQLQHYKLPTPASPVNLNSKQQS